jgi:hypothetical protein
MKTTKKTNYRYDLKQNGMIVASAECTIKEDALKEIQHYALMYSQDGDVEIIEK